MTRCFLVVLILLWSCGCKPQRGEETTPTPQVAGEQETYRLASWNVRNLFDPVDDSYNDDVLTSEEYSQKLGELAAVIDALEADILVLQEVENMRCLQDLNRALARPYPQLGLIEGNDTIRGIDVCFLSRLPVARVSSHKKHRLPTHPDAPKRYGFSRDCLEVRLQTQPSVTLLVNHFKSARGDAKKSAAKRRVQAAGVVEIAKEVDAPGRALFVVGDLNGPQDSWALEPLSQNFEDAFAHIPKEERITHRFRKGGSALDHILVDHDAAQILGERKIWKEVARSTSDHNPISADIRLRKLGSGHTTIQVWEKPDS